MNEKMKRYLSLVIKEMRIKATMRYYYILNRMYKIERLTISSGQGCGESETCIHCWSVKCTTTPGMSFLLLKS